MNWKASYEVPAEMRELAELNVEQARKAFDGFISAARMAIDATTGSTGSAQSNMQDIGRKAIAHAESNIAAAFELAQKLLKSKDVAEALQHQSDFLKTQMAAFQAQIKEMGETAQGVAAKAAENASMLTKTK